MKRLSSDAYEFIQFAVRYDARVLLAGEYARWVIGDANIRPEPEFLVLNSKALLALANDNHPEKVTPDTWRLKDAKGETFLIECGRSVEHYLDTTEDAVLYDPIANMIYTGRTASKPYDEDRYVYTVDDADPKAFYALETDTPREVQAAIAADVKKSQRPGVYQIKIDNGDSFFVTVEAYKYDRVPTESGPTNWITAVSAVSDILNASAVLRGVDARDSVSSVSQSRGEACPDAGSTGEENHPGGSVVGPGERPVASGVDDGEPGAVSGIDPFTQPDPGTFDTGGSD